MAQRTLVENVAQVKADFKSVREAINYAIPKGTPTSEYGERIHNEISNLMSQADSNYNYGFEVGRTEGIEQGRQEVISNSKYIEKSASGKVIRLDDVSEVAHKVVVKADTPTEVKVCGKNLFNNDFSLVKVVTYSGSSGSQVSRNGYELHLPAGTYTATLTPNGTGSDVFWYGIINDANGNYVQSASLFQNTTNRTPFTFTINEGDVLYWYDGYQGRTFQQSWDKCFRLCQVQLEVGYVSTPYESYKEPQTITATPDGVEIPSNCPTMTFIADNDVTVDYYASFGMAEKELAMWKALTLDGARANYHYGFASTNYAGYTIPEGMCKPKSIIAYMFYSYDGTELPNGVDCSEFRCDGSLSYQLISTFAYATKLKKIYDMKIPMGIRSYNGTYLSSTALEEIEVIRSNENTSFTNNVFQSCSSLVEVKFEGTIASNINLQWSTKLSLESLISLFSSLKVYSSDDADYCTKTITLSAESWALTESQDFQDALGYTDGQAMCRDLGWNYA